MVVLRAAIQAAKRVAEIERKKRAKIPAREARAVAREQMRGSGNTGRKINKRTGLTPEEKNTLTKKSPVSKRQGRPRNPEDVRRGRSVAEYEMRMRLSNPPKAKPSKPIKKEVFLTRGKTVAKRSEVEEVTQKRLQKQARIERAEEKFKKMTPEQKRTLMARAQVKRAQRDEAAGRTKYGMDVKPREQLDKKVVERAKELTAQERNEIARKQAFESKQRREADRRAAEGLKDRNKKIKQKMKYMTPDQKRRYINYLKESGW